MATSLCESESIQAHFPMVRCARHESKRGRTKKICRSCCKRAIRRSELTEANACRCWCMPISSATHAQPSQIVAFLAISRGLEVEGTHNPITQDRPGHSRLPCVDRRDKSDHEAVRWLLRLAGLVNLLEPTDHFRRCVVAARHAVRDCLRANGIVTFQTERCAFCKIVRVFEGFRQRGA
jgi:hypothetical protein